MKLEELKRNIMSKYQLKKSSIYYADSSVPVNKLGIKDEITLHYLEEYLLQEKVVVYFIQMY